MKIRISKNIIKNEFFEESQKILSSKNEFIVNLGDMKKKRKKIKCFEDLKPKREESFVKSRYSVGFHQKIELFKRKLVSVEAAHLTCVAAKMICLNIESQHLWEAVLSYVKRRCDGLDIEQLVAWLVFLPLTKVGLNLNFLSVITKELTKKIDNSKNKVKSDTLLQILEFYLNNEKKYLDTELIVSISRHMACNPQSWKNPLVFFRLLESVIMLDETKKFENFWISAPTQFQNSVKRLKNKDIQSTIQKLKILLKDKRPDFYQLMENYTICDKEKKIEKQKDINILEKYYFQEHNGVEAAVVAAAEFQNELEDNNRLLENPWGAEPDVRVMWGMPTDTLRRWLISFPPQQIVLLMNKTLDETKFLEAPVTPPISRNQRWNLAKYKKIQNSINNFSLEVVSHLRMRKTDKPELMCRLVNSLFQLYKNDFIKIDIVHFGVCLLFQKSIKPSEATIFAQACEAATSVLLTNNLLTLTTDDKLLIETGDKLLVETGKGETNDKLLVETYEKLLVETDVYDETDEKLLVESSTGHFR
eukprot:GHVL01041817.1.p1 GENE.GHVL01041817.1~~GHVL01041817.1.p1  ORF type:complete len:539 (-),score=130.76 GHVL01041817.1:136-1731(-)